MATQPPTTSGALFGFRAHLQSGCTYDWREVFNRVWVLEAQAQEQDEGPRGCRENPLFPLRWKQRIRGRMCFNPNKDTRWQENNSWGFFVPFLVLNSLSKIALIDALELVYSKQNRIETKHHQELDYNSLEVEYLPIFQNLLHATIVDLLHILSLISHFKNLTGKKLRAPPPQKRHNLGGA